MLLIIMAGYYRMAHYDLYLYLYSCTFSNLSSFSSLKSFSKFSFWSFFLCFSSLPKQTLFLIMLPTASNTASNTYNTKLHTSLKHYHGSYNVHVFTDSKKFHTLPLQLLQVWVSLETYVSPQLSFGIAIPQQAVKNKQNGVGFASWRGFLGTYNVWYMSWSIIIESLSIIRKSLRCYKFGRYVLFLSWCVILVSLHQPTVKTKHCWIVWGGAAGLCVQRKNVSTFTLLTHHSF